MATLREFVLSQSTLPTGNTVREHIKHPGSGSGVGQIVAELEGTVLDDESLQGEIVFDELVGIVSDIEVVGVIEMEDVPGEVQDEDIEGGIEC